MQDSGWDPRTENEHQVKLRKSEKMMNFGSSNIIK